MKAEDIVKYMELSLIRGLINSYNVHVYHFDNKYIKATIGKYVLWFYEEDHKLITDEEELNILNIIY